EQMQTLVRARLDADGVAYVVEAAYPLPGEPSEAAELQDHDPGLWLLRPRLYEHQRDRQLGLRGLGLHTQARFNDEQPQNARSAWAIWNSVAEVEDHLRGGPSRIRQRSAIFGAGAATKRRAFRAALELA